MTIKVNKARLISSLAKKKLELEAEVKAREIEQAPLLKGYKSKILKAMDEFAIKVSASKTYDEVMNLYFNMPASEFKHYNKSNSRGSIERQIKDIENALTKLSLVEDETITLNERSDSSFIDLLSK